MRRPLLAVTVAAFMFFPSTVAHAESGWARFQDHYVRWSTTMPMPITENPRAWSSFLDARAHAIKRAKKSNVRWRRQLEEQRRLAALLVPLIASSSSIVIVPSGPINWYAIADCESGGGDGLPPYTPNWAYNGPSGFDGGLQFLPSTWLSAGGGKYAPYAWGATADEQIAIASTLPLSAWPYCQRFA